MIGGDLLECLATTVRVNSDSGLQLRAMGAAFAHGWEPSSQGWYPASRSTMGPVQKKPDQPSISPCACNFQVLAAKRG